MKIVDLLNPAAIVSNLQAADKNTALEELADAIVGVENGLDRQEVIGVLQERERLGMENRPGSFFCCWLQRNRSEST